jgi:hypothetical protein
MELLRGNFNTLRKWSYLLASNQILCKDFEIEILTMGQSDGLVSFACWSVLQLCVVLL